ncbi:MATE family efflux transporter [Pilosibacter fragilis]|uniref:MATE family efflux transporter n=2 Tax=Pilosibacter fragilis TaxID=3078042 RepID=UPI0032D40D9D
MKEKMETGTDLFRTEKIPKILLKIAPPVMLAQLIQAMYNIVDSFFVGQYSANSLTALSVIYPLQLIIIALAVGTGVGVNTYMARQYAQKFQQKAEEAAGTGMVLEFMTWLIFAVLAAVFMRPYVMTSAKSPEAIEDAVIYGRIVCIGSIGAFLEGNWTKVHQSKGNMRRPMIAQTVGALTNIVLDPIMIFGLGPVPQMGVAGAAYATVCGQVAAAVITAFGGVRRPPEFRKMKVYIKQIYWLGYASILQQAMYTVYIVILNAILAGFSDSAVTVLGLYYKMQTFFFIPLMGLQTCIVPVLSFNYATKSYGRCRETMKDSYLFSCGFMLIGGGVSCSFRWNCSGSFRTAVRSLQSEKRRFRSLDRVLFRRYFH